MALRFMNVVGPFAKQLGIRLFSENVAIGQSFFKCPSLSACTVIEFELQ